jgi:hypothetical protein
MYSFLTLVLAFVAIVNSAPINTTNQYIDIMNATIIDEPILKNGTNPHHKANNVSNTTITVVCILAPMIFSLIIFGFCTCKKFHIKCCGRVSGYETI